MTDRKLILPAELKVCATCAYWDGARAVDDDVRVVVVSESCKGECLVRDVLMPPLRPVQDGTCLWDYISGDQQVADGGEASETDQQVADDGEAKEPGS